MPLLLLLDVAITGQLLSYRSEEALILFEYVIHLNCAVPVKILVLSSSILSYLFFWPPPSFQWI